MDNTQKWWDDFWQKEKLSNQNRFDGSLSYFDLIWKVVGKYWHDQFEKFAPGKIMLEGGCGSAKVSQYMARCGYNCTLLDYSQSGLNLARNVFDSSNLNAQFVLGDLNRLPFLDDQFDIVYSGGVLEFFEDVQKPVNEMARVLKPGGILAVNMVPRKFSIQTIADIERTIACSMANLIKGRFDKVFKVVRNIPKEYNVHSFSLERYSDVFKKAGIDSVVARVTSPFPILALPSILEGQYVKMMQKMIRQWQKFNQTDSFMSRIFGITYSIYGIKKAQEKK